MSPVERNNELAIERAWRTMTSLLRRFVRLPEDDAQDVLSLALIRLWTEVRRHPDQAPAERWTPGYLSHTLRFAMHDWLRSKRKEGSGRVSWAVEVTQLEEPEARSEVEAALFRIAVQSEVLSWSSEDRRFFDQLVGAALLGVSDAELAERLRMPASTFSSKKLRLLVRLEAALDARPR